MERVEVSGKSVDEAIQQGLETLGVSREEVNIEVLSEGKTGIFGFGSEEARVRLSTKEAGAAPTHSGEQQLTMAHCARDVVQGLLARMGIEATVEVHEQMVPGVAHQQPSVEVSITGDDLGILIGRRGETLSSLQYLVNVMVGRRLRSRTAISVDVAGYRQQREVSLRNLAQRVAERVISTGQAITLEPMPAHERRIIHTTLLGNPKIVTQSLGDGETRKVFISLRKPATSTLSETLQEAAESKPGEEWSGSSSLPSDM